MKAQSMKAQSALLDALTPFLESGELRSVDVQFATLVSTYTQAQTQNENQNQAQTQTPNNAPDQLVLLSALVSRALAEGDVCLPLARLQSPTGFWSAGLCQLIQQYDWQQALPNTPDILSNGESLTLLVVDHQRVYLYRYWQYECDVAANIRQRATNVPVQEALLAKGLNDFFGNDETDVEIDWQKVSAAVAVQKGFSVISGGPGTGKTTTVIKLLALYIQQCLAEHKQPIIRLVAPTGKAAARLAESISSAKQRLALPEEIETFIPNDASTLHRLLGVLPNTRRFRHDQFNPLHVDLLVLDEASMVDLSMMKRLLDALPATTRLVLLGDREQLASVEAGSVLGDICSWSQELTYSTQQAAQLSRLCDLTAPIVGEDNQNSGIADALCQLRKSYRFNDQSGIGVLAKTVNQGLSRQIKAVFDSGFNDLQFTPITQDAYAQVIEKVANFYADIGRQAREGVAAKTLLATMASQQLLCALRQGHYGVEGINEHVLQKLNQLGALSYTHDTQWYAGKPVIITRNEASLSLYNGDIGVVAPDSDGRLKVWFEQQGEIKSYLPSRLPEHETVYAMTIHKSQGSEFENVIMLLPPNENPVLTRELLYTGITRAKQHLHLCTRLDVMAYCTHHKTMRSGGLAQRLWGDTDTAEVAS